MCGNAYGQEYGQSERSEKSKGVPISKLSRLNLKVGTPLLSAYSCSVSNSLPKHPARLSCAAVDRHPWGMGCSPSYFWYICAAPRVSNRNSYRIFTQGRCQRLLLDLLSTHGAGRYLPKDCLSL